MEEKPRPWQRHRHHDDRRGSRKIRGRLELEEPQPLTDYLLLHSAVPCRPGHLRSSSARRSMPAIRQGYPRDHSCRPSSTPRPVIPRHALTCTPQPLAFASHTRIGPGPRFAHA